MTWILVLFLANFALPGTAGATPPKDIKLDYDQATQMLKVTIVHFTLAESLHYIKHVLVKKNGVEVGSYFYKSQPERETFTYTYSLAANPGDTIEVTAACNIWGSKRVSLKIAGS